MGELLLKNFFELLAATLAVAGVEWIRFAYKGENFALVQRSVDFFLVIQGLAIGTFSCVGIGILCVHRGVLGNWDFVIVAILSLGVLAIVKVLNLGMNGFFSQRTRLQYCFRSLPLILLLSKLLLELKLHEPLLE